MSEQAQGKSSFDRLIEKPRFNFWWGIALAGVGLVGGWWLTRNVVEFSYISFPTEFLAKKDSGRMTVLWDGNPISDLCVARIALINSGNSTLNQSHFPSNDPLRLVGSVPIELKAVEVVNASRPSLSMAATLNEKNDAASLGLVAGDALEPGDGLAFRVLFTGDCSKARLLAVGRVVGSTVGPVRHEGYTRRPVIEVPLFSAIAMFLLVALRLTQESFKDAPKSLWTMAFLGVAPLLLSLLLAGIVIAIYTRDAPSWLP